MKLYGSARSPYVLKVLAMLGEKGLAFDFDEVKASGPEVAAANPLGKVPTLIRDDGRPLYDSSVILEYLDGLKAPRLIPDNHEGRVEARRQEALATGIMDAAVNIIHELREEEGKRKGADYIAKQQGKIDAALDAFEAELGGRDWLGGAAPGLGDVACGAALVYLSRARRAVDWRATRPGLARLMEKLAARDAFKGL